MPSWEVITVHSWDVSRISSDNFHEDSGSAGSTEFGLPLQTMCRSRAWTRFVDDVMTQKDHV